MADSPTVQTTAGGVPFVRTSDDRFEDLPDYPYEPRYVEVDGFRMAYVDEGGDDEGGDDEGGDRGSGRAILLPHGEPTWGYLYRRMIPTLVAAGHRVIVPDLIGFGRSDKPTERSVYTYNRHVAWMKEFLDQFGDVTSWDIFCQDWGGLISLRVAAEQPDRIGRLVIGNSGLPRGESLGPGFDFWLELSQKIDPFDCGRLVDNTVSSRDLTDAEKAAYNAPFPDEHFLAGAREFPCLVPITPDHDGVAENLAAREVFRSWTRPVLLLWGLADPVLGHLHEDLTELIPGIAGQPHRFYDNGNHFVQDDIGAPLAEAMVEWLR